MENMNCKGCDILCRILAGTDHCEDAQPRDFSSDAGCSRHAQLMQHFKDAGAEIDRIEHRTWGPYLVDSWGHGWDLLLVNKPSEPGCPGKHRVLDPDWADIDLLPLWKDRCLKTHGQKCENPMKIWKVRPAWLIDVELECLVPGHQSNEAFVALSYVYGTRPWFKITDKAALSRLQGPGSLGVPEMLACISPTIKHAMYLTKVLGERFLWADALCIPHIESKVSADQLNLMGAIYANAIVTIVVADTGSDKGIPGLRGVSHSREMKQAVIQFGTDQLVVAEAGHTHLSINVVKTPYNTRGWTYQESSMSGRNVIFMEKEFRWECSCSFWGEELVTYMEVRTHGGFRRDLDAILAGFPDTEGLSQALSAFNSRQLSFAEDALPSISGLLSVFSRSFVGGFLYGLPESFFDSTLGWQAPYLMFNRRRPSSGVSRTRLGPSGLPSWSWVGWRAQFARVFADDPFVYPHTDTIRETFPVTTWFTAGSPSAPASRRRQIFSTWFTDRETYKEVGNDTNKPLPPGWTRHKVSDAFAHLKGMTILYPEGCGQFVFKHAALKDEHELEKSLFNHRINWAYYPFPIQEISGSALPYIPEQTEYLFCKTHRTYLWAARKANHGGFCILNAENMRVGHLVRPTLTHMPRYLGGDGSDWEYGRESMAFPLMKDKDGSGKEENDQSPPGIMIELVAISRQKVYMKEEGPPVPGSLAARATVTERIAVLSVEWVDGVAYRRDYGEVDKEEWDKLPLEPIELILG
ncbi:putative heterokaryon incompatibility protein [Rosellinia necatrix]|uniref:Putative heterokaryon incompatibility protein n=1 Tax=Rosellinia necatrix TaxID=77044 RepID=A0A1W2TF81_ROSNE|nr:putative heterokaryon incompatibility protein [Rosellinia necatrix]